MEMHLKMHDHLNMVLQVMIIIKAKRLLLSSVNEVAFFSRLITLGLGTRKNESWEHKKREKILVKKIPCRKHDDTNTRGMCESKTQQMTS